MTTNFTLRVSSTGEAPSVIVNEGGTVDLEPINQHLTTLDNEVSSLVSSNSQNEDSINLLNASVSGLSNLVGSIEYKVNTNGISANVFTGGLLTIPFSYDNGITYDNNIIICRVGFMKHLIIRSFVIPANTLSIAGFTIPIIINWGTHTPQQIEEVVGSDRTLEMYCPVYWTENPTPDIIRRGVFNFKLSDQSNSEIKLIISSISISTINTFKQISLTWI